MSEDSPTPRLLAQGQLDAQKSPATQGLQCCSLSRPVISDHSYQLIRGRNLSPIHLRNDIPAYWNDGITYLNQSIAPPEAGPIGRPTMSWNAFS